MARDVDTLGYVGEATNERLLFLDRKLVIVEERRRASPPSRATDLRPELDSSARLGEFPTTRSRELF